MSAQREKAETLRALHRAPELLVLVNVWDVVSARTVAGQPGCGALATASWAVAAAHGYPDGEAIPLELVLATLSRIAGASDLPVTVDLERGYGDVAATVRAAVEHGAVGSNLEDSTGDRAAPLRPRADAVQQVAAAVGAGGDAGVPLVVNARTDVYLRAQDGADPGALLDEAVERGRGFLAAGADCVFVPGVADAAVIGELVGALGSVSVLARPDFPPLAELERLGVRRVSFGPGPLGVASAALARAAAELLAHGDYPDDLGYRG